MDANSLAQNVVPGRFNSLTVRFVSLVVILQTIHARAHLVQPRDFDFNNDFGFGTESLGVDLRYTPSEDAVNLADAFTSGSVEGVSLTDPNINLAFASDSGLNADEFSTEQLDLANIISADITFTPPDIAANVFAVEPQNSAIGSDVSITNLGLSDGDLIASVNLFFDFTVIAGVLSGSKNIASFIFNFGIQNILNAADNFSFSLSSSAFFIDSASSSSASSLDNVEIKNVGFVAPSKNSEPFTFSSEFEKIFNAAEIKPTFSTSDTSIVIDSDFGVSASSPEKLQIADVEFVAPSESDNKIALSPGAEDFLKPAKKPFSGSSKTFVSPIEKTPFGVGVNPATLSEGDLNLSTFKAGTETLATDVKLPPKMQEYFDRVTKAPLTQNDWKIISEDLNLGGNSQAPISTTNSQVLTLPAQQALRGITVRKLRGYSKPTRASISAGSPRTLSRRLLRFKKP